MCSVSFVVLLWLLSTTLASPLDLNCLPLRLTCACTLDTDFLPLRLIFARFIPDFDFLPMTLDTMAEPQPSTSRCGVEDEPQPSTSRFAVEAEPQPSTSRSAVEAEPQPSTSRSAVEAESQPSTSRSAVDDDPQSSSSSAEEDEPPSKRHLYVEEVRGMWNLVKIYCRLGTREQAVAFAEERGMIPREKLCNYHKKPMSINYSTNKTVGSFVCNRGPCKARSRVSRGKGTWFDNIKILMPQVFYLMYAFSEKFSYDKTLKEDFSEGEHCLSRSTINDWFNCCREAVVVLQKNKQELTGIIGEPSKIIHPGTHTQTIKSQWHVIKRYFNKNNYNYHVNINNSLYEYLWRRDVERLKKDPFEELINAINYSFNK